METSYCGEKKKLDMSLKVVCTKISLFFNASFHELLGIAINQHLEPY